MSRVGSRQSRADGSGDAQTKLLRGGGTVVSAQFLASVTKSQDAVVLSATEVSRMKVCEDSARCFLLRQI